MQFSLSYKTNLFISPFPQLHKPISSCCEKGILFNFDYRSNEGGMSVGHFEESFISGDFSDYDILVSSYSDQVFIDEIGNNPFYFS